MADTSGSNFWGGTTVSTGEVIVEADLWFQELNSYVIAVLGGLDPMDPTYLTLEFWSDGTMDAHYNDPLETATGVATYTAQSGHVISLHFDLNAPALDVYLDRQSILSVPLNVVNPAIGIVIFGCGADSEAEGSYHVDNIRVTDTFTSSLETTWGRIKALHMN